MIKTYDKTKKTKKGILAVLMAVSILISSMPSTALANPEKTDYAEQEAGTAMTSNEDAAVGLDGDASSTSALAPNTYDLAQGSIRIDGGTETGTIKVTYGEEASRKVDDNLAGDSIIVITQTNFDVATKNSITVGIPTSVSVKLSGVNINARFADFANDYGKDAFVIEEGAGAVNLILADGTVNTLASTDKNTGGKPGLRKSNVARGEEGRLTISGDTNGTGSLIAIAGGNGAGIGGAYLESSGYITITSGTVTALGGYGASGIGGGSSGGDGHHISITGGTVTATGKDGGAGIGGGRTKYKADGGGNGSDILITGGTVTASSMTAGKSGGAGIGGGSMSWRDKPNGKGGNGSKISITGGTVSAAGCAGGAGIGGGSGAASGEVIHNGGDGSEISITGGTVIAAGGSGGAGIGGGTGGRGNGMDGQGSYTGGNGGTGSNITIRKGTVTVLLAGDAGLAKGIGGGGYKAAVVPPGYSDEGISADGTDVGSSDNLIISGGNVNAVNVGCVPTSDGSTKVYKTALAVPNDTTGGTDVSSLTFTSSGSTFAYDMTGAKSILSGTSGMVYAYLPEAAATAVYNNGTYYATVTTDHQTVFTPPSYTVSVEPVSKDFGSKAEGYTALPVAQTVTIKSTGNNGVTLKQPTSTNYTIGALSTTKLAAGGEATFTVRPKSGLSSGKYPETIEITVVEDAAVKAELAVNFQVIDTVPTLTWEPDKQEVVYTGKAAAITAPVVTGNIENEQPTGQLTYKYKSPEDTKYRSGLPTNTGTYTVIASIEAKGSYESAESKEMVLTITPKALNESNIVLNGTFTYNGKAHTPQITVQDGETTLIPGTDYDMSLSNNIEAGENTALAKVRFKGSYTGTADKTFSIGQAKLTWDASELTSQKDYKAGGDSNIEIEGKLKVEGVVGQDDAAFTYDSLTGICASNVPGIQTVTVTVNNSKLTGQKAGNYLLPSEVITIQGLVIKVSFPNVAVKGAESGKEYKLRQEEGIYVVPDALKTNGALNTAGKIEERMKASISQKMEDVNRKGIQVSNLKLMVKETGTDAWKEATKANFPKEGITATLPYPEGTGETGFEFVVSHMLTEDMGAKKAGDIEYLVPEKTKEGLKCQFSSLSPVAVGYKAVQASGGQKPVAPTKPDGQNKTPMTGDYNTPSLWLLLLSLSAGAIWTVIVKKKR